MGERIRIEWTQENADKLATELRELVAERDQLREDLAQKDEAIGYMRDRLNHTEVPPLRRERDRYRAALEELRAYIPGRGATVREIVDRALEPTEAPHD